jgi:putative hydrolase
MSGTPTATDQAYNQSVADKLVETADVLKTQDANPFRINAYRRAAQTVRGLDEDLRELVAREGRDGLLKLAFIGRGLAATIEEIVHTGSYSRLDRLRGDTSPERLFQSVPGIGPVLAERIHEHLHVDTLEALEQAAHDGRLEAISGVGTRRAAAIRGSLSELLGRRRRPPPQKSGPSVGQLLDVDHEYRTRAAANRLPRIAPRRFNPSGEAWLPILHTDRDGWHFTALYSNTARAHELGRTYDWVVLYFYDGEHEEGQHTIVTETRGPQEGRRVVRGREPECARYYRERHPESHATRT